MNLLRKKDISQMLTENHHGPQLEKVLNAFDLTLLGIGAIIGTGIFVLTGQGAVTAGPGLAISFIIAALACSFAALAYAEFASAIPVSGSVYTYTYVTIGEFMAWFIGWDLILEYSLAISAVSVGWSGYFQSLLGGIGIHIPEIISAAPGIAGGAKSIFNLPAFLIILLITFTLSRGVKESSRINNIMVILKVAVICLFIVVGSQHVKPSNWQPFAPYGFSGILHASALVFFAYIGFDAVSSAAEEVKNPARDMPRGIIYSLAICTVLYVTVVIIMTGITPYTSYTGVDHPVSLALQIAGQSWVAGFIDIGAIVGMATVLLVLVFAQTRIVFAMSRDGLVPPVFSKIHTRFKTPAISTWSVGISSAFIGALVPLDRLAELTNIGTLSAFVMISLAVLIMRKTHPELPRTFRCPGVPVIPMLAMGLCFFLMTQLLFITWLIFLIWMLVGITIYFLYSRQHSKLHHENKKQSSC
ncbi:MAG TPA: amino acid permease [Syntrophus sp. (in: bacteria)]|jgi:APA family basic amino acid/polyamine antiporter|nr:amino acid permease [Syntrophus sp. (in: bacteria)]